MIRQLRPIPLVLVMLLGIIWMPLNASELQPVAAYVVLGQTPTGEQLALARVLIEQADAVCPSLEPAQGGDHRAMIPRHNPDPGNFAVTVCEARYPIDGSRLRVHGTSVELPPVPLRTSRVVVFGDTGCKPRYQHGCDKAADWPFKQMADAAAKARPGPDLVLHMGDYNYRGTPGKVTIKRRHHKAVKGRVYDAGDNVGSTSCIPEGPYHGQNSLGSKTPDSWKAWKHDFFQPAAKLLRAAPWVVARGNHELCSRAGPGWFYFLDPGSDLVQPGGQLACPAAENAEPLIFDQPYRVDAGGLSVLVLDSANACDQGDLHQQHFDAQFEQLQSLVQEAPVGNALWLQSHRPLWGLRKPDANTAASELDASGQYGVIDRTLQSALAAHPLPTQIHLVLSGHMHRFQALDFEPPGRLPSQLIIGNGGVELAHNYPKAPFSVDIGGQRVVGFGLKAFGYMDITPGRGGDWSGRLLDRHGKLLACCDASDRSSTGACAPMGQ